MLANPRRPRPPPRPKTRRARAAAQPPGWSPAQQPRPEPPPPANALVAWPMPGPISATRAPAPITAQRAQAAEQVGGIPRPGSVIQLCVTVEYRSQPSSPMRPPFQVDAKVCLKCQHGRLLPNGWRFRLDRPPGRAESVVAKGEFPLSSLGCADSRRHAGDRLGCAGCSAISARSWPARGCGSCWRSRLMCFGRRFCRRGSEASRPRSVCAWYHPSTGCLLKH